MKKQIIIDGLKNKYGLKGNTLIITTQVLKDNPLNKNLQYIYDCVGDKVEVLFNDTYMMIVYDKLKACYNDMPSCVEILDNNLVVVEKIYF